MRAKNRFATAAFVGMICALASAWPAAARTIYVDDDAPGDPGPGDPTVSDPLENGSAAHPYDAIQQGINAAVAGDTVLVADGTYTGTGNKDLDFAGKAITVQSASGNPAACSIDCQGSGRGFYFHSGETAASKVAGFTIRNGLVTSSSPGSYYGGAVYCYSNSSPTLTNCAIYGNSATYGGAVGCRSSSGPTLSNCAISGNSGTNGGGVYCSSASPTLTNCTISGNVGRGLYCSASSPRLVNCILWGDTAGEIYVSSGTPAVTYCVVQGGWLGTGNLSVDPLLVRGDYHVQAGSPCLDAGDPTGAYTGQTDIDGEARLAGAQVDIGADEFIDSDNDGLPDWWETKYFGSATAGDPTGDPDNDGQTNLAEYARNTNPFQGPTTYYVDVAGNNAWDGLAPVWDGQHGPKATIQAAIAAADRYEGDQVVLAPGTYTGAGNRDLDVGGKVLTVRGLDPEDPAVVAATVIDCQGSSSSPHRGFWFHTSECADSVLAGLTIRNGYMTTSGGAVLCDHSSPTIRRCVITGNYASSSAGGGIACTRSAATIDSCTLQANSGTGIYCSDGSSAEIRNCTVSGNPGRGIRTVLSSPTITDCVVTANQGTGIDCDRGSAIVTGCTLSQNTDSGLYLSQCNAAITECEFTANAAYSQGAGINSYSSSPTITNCTFVGNNSPTHSLSGGGIYCSGGSPTIADCVFRDNILASGQGGGIYLTNGTPSVQRCTFTGNSAGSGSGGGVCVYGGSPTLADCTFDLNTAGYSGGAIFAFNGSTTALVRCTFTGNRVDGSQPAGGGAIECDKGSSTVTNCSFSQNHANNQGGAVRAVSGQLTITASTFLANTAGDGAGLYQSGGVALLVDCTLSDGSAVYGGAVEVHGGELTLSACRLTGNATTQMGGAIYAWSGGTRTLTDCMIAGNTAAAGGALELEDGSATLTGCQLLGNVASGGGAITSSGCALTLVNCILANNAATVTGGALRLWNGCDTGGVVRLVNCTLAANSSPDGAGIATASACTAFNDTLDVVNSILWNSGPEIANSAEVLVTVTSSDVRGGWPGHGNLAADPLFVAPAGPDGNPTTWLDNDFHLRATSPCINAGDNTAPLLPPLDFEGEDRIQQCQVDIGADESPYFQDCNGNGVSDACEIADGTSADCNNNGRPDACDIAAGTARDADGDGVPDACEIPLRYVRASAGAGGNGLNWSTAYKDLQSVLAEAASLQGVVHEIWVAAGTYKPDSGTGDRLRTFQLVSGVAVYGGFAGNEIAREARDPQAHLTVLSGDLRGNDGAGFSNNGENSHHVVTGSGCDASAVLDGFTVRGGKASGPPPWTNGAGMYNSHGSPTVRNCVFVANAADGSGGGMSNNDGSDANVTACRFDGNRAYTSGGGIDNRQSSPTITACTFTGNQVTYLDGGAIGSYWGSNATISDCTATGNQAVQFGGAFCFEGESQPSVQRCTLTGNTAAFGGAVATDLPVALVLTECLILGNTAQRGGAMCVWGSGHATLHDCVLSGNRATEYGGALQLYSGSSANVTNCALLGNAAPRGGGVHASTACTVVLANCTLAGHTGVGRAVICEYSTTTKSNVTARNCILWDGGDEIRNNDSSTITVAYSDVQGGWIGTGNLSLDPLFVNAAGPDGVYGTADDNVHLLPTSPCIDAGDPASDFSLEPEPDGGRINMGAYGNTPEAETKGWIYIDAYHITRKTRVGRTLFEYDLTTTVRNAGSQSVTNLVATLLAAPSNVQVIDAIVNVGDVPAGSTVESVDTFTIRVDRTTLVSPLPISWRVTYGSGFTEFTTLLDLGAPPRQPGDANCDGHVDFDDINPFVLALTGADGYYNEYPECDWLNADCNGDGLVDFDDINAFVALLTQ
jgi:hypothetical protein